jgi:hypothetical protein
MIVLGLVLLLLVIGLISIPIPVNTYAVTFANITDGEPRIALVQAEDFTYILYRTINGTTERIDGFNDLEEFVNDWAIPTFSDDEEIEKESSEDNGGSSDDSEPIENSEPDINNLLESETDTDEGSTETEEESNQSKPEPTRRVDVLPGPFLMDLTNLTK